MGVALTVARIMAVMQSVQMVAVRLVSVSVYMAVVGKNIFILTVTDLF